MSSTLYIKTKGTVIRLFEEKISNARVAVYECTVENFWRVYDTQQHATIIVLDMTSQVEQLENILGDLLGMRKSIDIVLLTGSLRKYQVPKKFEGYNVHHFETSSRAVEWIINKGSGGDGSSELT